MLLARYLSPAVKKDLQRKMVFIGGPRQVGKTTLAHQLRAPEETGYLNWDVPEDQERILKRELPLTPLLVLDEIHKYRLWRNYLKGLYDAQQVGKKARQEILVTGSARLDVYRFSGDSLQGRYHYLRLLPLSVAELQGPVHENLTSLLQLGGFPEPFFTQSESESRRWSREYRTRLLREDLRDLEQVRNISMIALLMSRLPSLIGSPLSINSLREDLQVAHKTVAHWIEILERLYALFRIPPLGGPKIRAIKKEQKAYLFDWTLVPELPMRFENLVAVHLLKHVFFLEDTQGLDIELRYFRDLDGREVDFVVVQDQKPILLVECKLGDQPLSPHLRYLHQKYPQAKAYQIHFEGQKDYQTLEGIRVCSAASFLAELT